MDLDPDDVMVVPNYHEPNTPMGSDALDSVDE